MSKNVSELEQRRKEIESEESKLVRERHEIESKIWRAKRDACKHNAWKMTMRMHGSSDAYKCTVCGAEDFF